MNRRDFVSAAAASAALAAMDSGSAAEGGRTKPLRILILGGTGFLGLHMTEIALRRGHELTYFNRGRTNPGVFPQVERLLGDRNGQIDSLRGRKWDAVIDNSGYVPRHVRLSAELLAPNVQQYLFVSSISVYPDFSVPRDESSPVAKLEDPSTETVDGATFGGLKALCEQAARAAMPERVTVVRPGLIVGPDDPTDRFTYWPARAARGGDMLTPGTPKDGVQFIDARDLAAFALDTLEKRLFGTFNALSPPGMFTMGQLIDACVDAANQIAKPTPPPRAVWVDATFLEQQKVAPWSDMPVWLPARDEMAAASQTSANKALEAGLKIRPIGPTVRDTLRWHLERPEAERAKPRAGIAPDREKKVLAAWRQQQSRSA